MTLQLGNGPLIHRLDNEKSTSTSTPLNIIIRASPRQHLNTLHAAAKQFLGDFLRKKLLTPPHSTCSIQTWNVKLPRSDRRESSTANEDFTGYLPELIVG